MVIRTLRRNNVRKKIDEYLFDINPGSSYTSEIAYNVKTTPTNVIGAIRGIQSRYKEDESLISLKIVEAKSGGKNIKLYSLNPFDKEIIENSKKRKITKDIFIPLVLLPIPLGYNIYYYNLGIL